MPGVRRQKSDPKKKKKFHASRVLTRGDKDSKQAAERHKPRKLGGAAESCIAADAPLEKPTLRRLACDGP